MAKSVLNFCINFLFFFWVNFSPMLNASLLAIFQIIRRFCIVSAETTTPEGFSSVNATSHYTNYFYCALDSINNYGKETAKGMGFGVWKKLQVIIVSLMVATTVIIILKSVFDDLMPIEKSGFVFNYLKHINEALIASGMAFEFYYSSSIVTFITSLLAFQLSFLFFVVPQEKPGENVYSDHSSRNRNISQFRKKINLVKFLNLYAIFTGIAAFFVVGMVFCKAGYVIEGSDSIKSTFICSTPYFLAISAILMCVRFYTEICYWRVIVVRNIY